MTSQQSLRSPLSSHFAIVASLDGGKLYYAGLSGSIPQWTGLRGAAFQFASRRAADFELARFKADGGQFCDVARVAPYVRMNGG